MRGAFFALSAFNFYHRLFSGVITGSADAEEKIASLEARIEAHRPPDVKHAVAEVREYAYKSIFDMKSLFRAVTQKTKVKLAQHVKELVLTPKQRDGEWVYEVTGEWELLPGNKCVILMVARDEVEQHYTHLVVPTEGIILDPSVESSEKW